MPLEADMLTIPQSGVPGRAEPAGDLRQELRGNALFAGLTEDQLGLVASCGQVRDLAEGDILITDGSTATHFYALLAGELVVTKIIDGHEEVLTRHVVPAPPRAEADDKPMAANYFTGEMPLLTDKVNVATIVAGHHATVISFPRDDFFTLLAQCPAISAVMLPVLAWRVRSSEMQARKQATIAALGTLAAGLAHELNNPASAITRAAAGVEPALHQLTETAYAWGEGATPSERDALSSLLRTLDKAPRHEGFGSSMGAAEDIFDWACGAGASDAARLSDSLAERGATTESLRPVLNRIGASSLPVALDHLDALLEVRDLAEDMRNAGTRISALVSATRGYSNLDRAPVSVFDVTTGIEATLAVLRHKLASVRVIREYADGVPPVSGNPSELNQVWTNLIDNAVDSMDGSGTITLRVSHEAGCVAVEVADTGSGIPPEVLPRIFEPFYTTKDVGKGTGLGLHLSHRIVTKSYGGSIAAHSVPGETRFLVRLPAAGYAGSNLCDVSDSH
jgi:signal transduction histidine kinase